ncbi:Catalase [Arthrobotrys entomopaga]|nr:Catalase [Arthrobotrys entomopaga]
MADQILELFQPPPPPTYYTIDNGYRTDFPQATVRVGGELQGPHLFQDINLIETISHLTHERIPERLVHAKGVGAYGVFEVTESISDLTKADFLSKVGKETKLFARFSTVVGERGSADSVRDTRGFAFKIYTDEGNLDWMFFSTPTFPIRDGGKFPSFTHCQKREPQTGLRSATTVCLSFMSSNPETFNTLMLIFSDNGTPKNYRHCDIFSANTYKFVTENSFTYVRIYLRTDQGVETLSREEAEKLAGIDPDAFTRDLHDKIASGDYPSWTVCAQVVQPRDMNQNMFDPTKRWPEDAGEWRKFGKITLNRNPDDIFGEVEQASFSPTAIIPGWNISPDPILQTRLFAYGSAARYRLGINFHQLEVNKPKYSYNPTKRDGAGYVNNLDPKIQPNYIASDGGSSFHTTDADYWNGRVQGYESRVIELDYLQPRVLWEEYKINHTDEVFVLNVATNLCMASAAMYFLGLLRTWAIESEQPWEISSLGMLYLEVHSGTDMAWEAPEGATDPDIQIISLCSH